MKCDICGNEDLFSMYMMKPVCSVCTIRFFGGGEPSPDAIRRTREALKIKDGEYFQQDCGAEAAKILGRK